MIDKRTRTQREASELEEPVSMANELAERLGLDPYPVNYWIVDYDEMNELIAYDGFQRRYPHWRWGMKYDRQQKQDQLGMGKAFEIVNNDNPCHAFLQETNSLADQKAVITHVEAHADFFRNNNWFGRFAGDDEDPDAAAMLERHADTIESYADDPEIDREDVERFVDAVLTMEDTIDQHQALAADREEGPDAEDLPDMDDRLDRLDISEEVRSQVFDQEWVDSQGEEGLANPRPDVLGFLLEHGKEYDDEEGKSVDRADWKDDILELLRREAYYFAPQKMTKVMNEGWACVTPETPVFSTEGLVPMREVVEEHHSVSDGDSVREVYDSNVIEDHETVTVETRRGFELTGSNNHRVRLPDGTWSRLDELTTGDTIEVSGGNDVWPTERATVDWSNATAKTLDDVAEEAGVSVWTVMRYRKTGRAREAEAIEAALDGYDGNKQSISANSRDDIRVPETVGPKFGRLLGLLVGDGHVSTKSGQVGFTSESETRAAEVAGLFDELFGVDPTVRQDGSRWRVQSYRENLIELLTDGIGLPSGKAAGKKSVPQPIRRSPRGVVAEFLRGLFDADGHAGEQGVIFSSKSETLSRQVLLFLTNFGILGRLREQSDGCHHVHLTGESAATFHEEIGFGYDDKRTALASYLAELEWQETDDWTDEIVGIEHGTADVYDISVEETHRYAAAGTISHNSKWESLMMSDEGFAGTDEILTYADHMARVLGSPGLNPYKLGFEIWQYVENRANRQEVIDKLLRVEGVSWRSFHDVIDFDEIESHLAPDETVAEIGPDTLADLDPEDPRVDADGLAAAQAGDVDIESYPWYVLSYEGLCERHFSLTKPQNRGFLRRVGRSELEQTARYMFDDERYSDVVTALADVDYSAGWDRMREVRESHNDVTFLDAFLTDEFVTEGNYFTYEYSQATGDYRVASTDVGDVKKKLLLQFTNFGKPTVAVYDGNFANRGELLLGHQYNGVPLDEQQARATLERAFQLWGRPVNLATIRTEYGEHELEVARRRGREPEGEEVGVRIRYDGMGFEEHDLDPEMRERLAADDVDYDTTPEEWLA